MLSSSPAPGHQAILDFAHISSISPQCTHPQLLPPPGWAIYQLPTQDQRCLLASWFSKGCCTGPAARGQRKTTSPNCAKVPCHQTETKLLSNFQEIRRPQPSSPNRPFHKSPALSLIPANPCRKQEGSSEVLSNPMSFLLVSAWLSIKPASSAPAVLPQHFYSTGSSGASSRIKGRGK